MIEVEFSQSMEVILNLVWAFCSAGLIWFWLRNSHTNPVPWKTQMLALMAIVLLLLPVISLSDDLLAMQGPAETDCCLRRALDGHDHHPSVVPAALAMPEHMISGLPLMGYSQDAVQTYRLVATPSALTPSLQNRPPPQA